jgi:hypothetical protein
MTDINVEVPDEQLAARLSHQLAESRTCDDTIRSSPVDAAFRTVPRHLFAPEASLEDIQAVMLEQALVQPGMRVLEIGSGGYNAALLTGPQGRVTTVDLDPGVTDRASRFLSAAGYSRVSVVLADAVESLPSAAPLTASSSPRGHGTFRQPGPLSSLTADLARADSRIISPVTRLPRRIEHLSLRGHRGHNL